MIPQSTRSSRRGSRGGTGASGGGTPGLGGGLGDGSHSRSLDTLSRNSSVVIAMPTVAKAEFAEDSRPGSPDQHSLFMDDENVEAYMYINNDGQMLSPSSAAAAATSTAKMNSAVQDQFDALAAVNKQQGSEESKKQELKRHPASSTSSINKKSLESLRADLKSIEKRITDRELDNSVSGEELTGAVHYSSGALTAVLDPDGQGQSVSQLILRKQIKRDDSHFVKKVKHFDTSLFTIILPAHFSKKNFSINLSFPQEQC